MKSITNIYIGKNPIQTKDSKVSGSELLIDDEVFFKISNVDSMRPFFMSIVSNSNHWLFISSTGGLSAGRKNSNYALFPYYTDDKITESNDHTGLQIHLFSHKICYYIFMGTFFIPSKRHL